MYGTESVMHIKDFNDFKKTFPQIPEPELSKFHSVISSKSVLINNPHYFPKSHSALSA